MVPEFTPLGELGLIVTLSGAPGDGGRADIARLHASLHAAPFLGFQEAVPGYTTLTVYADPWRWDAATLEAELRGRLGDAADIDLPPARLHELPVCYAGEYAPDLAWAARQTGLSEKEVVARHAGTEYRVELIGFAPGFAYLSGLDARLHLPRKASPRLRVPAGAVALAGGQTGVYPFAMPGGWQIIGRTRAALFETRREPPNLLSSGDRVRFVPLALEVFRELEAP